MEVILLQNIVLKGNRFVVGSKVVVDAELGKHLVANCLASEVPMIEPEPVIVEPVEPVASPKPRRRVARNKVAQ